MSNELEKLQLFATLQRYAREESEKFDRVSRVRELLWEAGIRCGGNPKTTNGTDWGEFRKRVAEHVIDGLFYSEEEMEK